ncbi:hypothetical protein LSCM4_04000 [Leishmania orientalis]|uniref:Uncharacterized protein n=1 Tax=Leishmania orientalis TaxID=2249476 RepID=A0A836HDN0_9TRYP|nr:hypothetical protein LSCM4_04000 [Leishmania orientalis]
MRVFSFMEKIYTTGTAPVNTSEDVWVEGKRYPAHMVGRAIVNHPTPILLTVALSLVLFVIGCAKIQSALFCSLDDYQIRSTIGVRRDALKAKSALDGWGFALPGAYRLSDSVNLSHPRTLVQGTVELRVNVDLQGLVSYADEVNMTPAERDAYANMLHPDLLSIYRTAERHVTQLAGYESVCFTSDLRNGQLNHIYPTCAPVSSVTQYVYPFWTGLE